MRIEKHEIYGDCLEAIGVPNKGIAEIDRDAQPEIFDVVWCDTVGGGSICGCLKQVIQTGKSPVVRSRYLDTSKNYIFMSPQIWGVVLTIRDSDGKVLWKRKSKTNADHIRSMSDEELAREAADALPYCAPGIRPSPERCTSKMCVGCWLDWLKQPKEKNK